LATHRLNGKFNHFVENVRKISRLFIAYILIKYQKS
jgi:hypothetical protein